ncbi:MAG: UvrD-helicase domain-containing protein, partial [Endomicrobiia bacterium]
MVIENIYSASAGTGKTYTLLNEIFNYGGEDKQTPTRSLKEVEELLKSTLFLSFSNSAVEELKSRIFKSIKSCPNNEKHQFDISSIRVYTIHSFVLEVIRMFRFELCLPDNVDFTENENYKIWYDVVDNFFRTKWTEDNLISLINENKAWPETINTNENKNKVVKLFLKFIDVKKKYFRKYIEKEGDKLFFILELGNNIEKFNNGQLNEPIINELDERVLDIIGLLSERYDKQQIKVYNMVINFLDNCNFILKSILIYLGNEYMQKMYQNGVYDYDAIIFLLLKYFVVGRPVEFIERLNDENWGIKNIYFDEAQDNDILQNYFISALGGNENFQDVKLKVVGDIKQSIYSWRGAYPQAFYKMMNEAQNINGCLQTLRTSFRIKSTRTLENINNLFNMIANRKSGWWYNEINDKLKLPESQNDTNQDIVWNIWDKENSNEYTNNEKNVLKKIIDNKGNIGILTRSRKNIIESGIIKELKKNKEFYGDIKFRYRLETKISNLSGIDSLIPEINIIKFLYTACKPSKQYLIPYMLLFTEVGKLIKNNVEEFKEELKIKDNKYNDAIIEFIKKIYEKLQKQENDFANNTDSEKIYKWMDNLWQYMYHPELKDTEWENPLETIRTIHHIIYGLYLFERNNRRMFENVQKQEEVLLQETVLPSQWYAIKDSNKENKDNLIIEVNTIHSSKGLEYDSVIIIGSSNEIFNDNCYENKSEHKYGDKYSGMTNIKFESILANNPKISIKLFPYLGTLTSRIVENSDIYNSIKNEIMCEQLNLFYVAVTRTKKNMIFIDL